MGERQLLLLSLLLVISLLTLRQHLPPANVYQVVECQVAVVAASEDS